MNQRIRFALCTLILASGAWAQDPTGSLRGQILDLDFEVPLGDATVRIPALQRATKTDATGSFALRDLAPGSYTVTISKDGFQSSTRTVTILAGKLATVDAALAPEFVIEDEYLVQDALRLGGSSDANLIQLRVETPAMTDFLGSSFIKKAGASDAASAIRLVPGATVAADSTPVVRGLPDRYVASSLNGVRLPSADEDKRAVQLDQFPATVIDSIRVAKTFTPDQQGDASGGAVDVRLKGIPDEPFFLTASAQTGFNTNVVGRHDFLTYEGGGVSFFGFDDGGRDPQLDRIGMGWLGAVGVAEGSTPPDYKWSVASGGNHTFDNDVRIGGLATFFYERDPSYFNDGIDDSYWVPPTDPNGGLIPRTSQGTVSKGEFVTSLFDVTRGKDTVQWGSLLTFGVEFGRNEINALFLYTRTTEDSSTLAEDTRGKPFFYPGYDPSDPNSNGYGELDAAPYIRFETLKYEERVTSSFQLNGRHTLPFKRFKITDAFVFEQPELDWTAAVSSASSNEPDRRQFGSQWVPARFRRGAQIREPRHSPFAPAENTNLGNVQRIFEQIEEDGLQLSINAKLPFKQWTGSEGFLKAGLFYDDVERTFDQDTYANFGSRNAILEGPFEQRLSSVFAGFDLPITRSIFDVDYEGSLKVQALYAMLSLPITEQFKVVGGARIESTEVSIVNFPASEFATWLPPDTGVLTTLAPGEADASISQTDILPSLGLEFKPDDKWIFRAAFSQTTAKQTFKELSPILQQEFVGGPIFVGNPFLKLSSVRNYDLRADYHPYAGGLVSVSWFRKEITDPIEVVQANSIFDYTLPRNYPEGELTGWEFEVRQDLGHFFKDLSGLSVGANATVINAKVTLPEDERAVFANSTFGYDISKRDMTNAPEFLYNLYVTYDYEPTGTQASLFYTVQGDTLLAGAALPEDNFVPSIYAREFGTLNFSLSQKITDNIGLRFRAKNLTNPKIEEVYRSDFLEGDIVTSSFTRGIDLSISISADFTF